METYSGLIGLHALSTRRTLGDHADNYPAYLLAGLVDEVGEWADEYHSNNYAKRSEELGDVLWYAAALIDRFSLDPLAIVNANIFSILHQAPIYGMWLAVSLVAKLYKRANEKDMKEPAAADMIEPLSLIYHYAERECINIRTTMPAVIHGNMMKLQERHPNGWNGKR